MSHLESLLSYPDGVLASSRRGANCRHYKVIAESATRSFIPGLSVKVLAYNGQTPGPLLTVQQGERVYLEYENRTDQPNGLHVHGLSKTNEQDGIPDIEPTPMVQPGESYTYCFQAWQAGTFFYHSSNPLQVAQGLLGPFVVLPVDGGHVLPPAYTRDYVLVLQQWRVNQPELGRVIPGEFEAEKFDLLPNFFTINGRSFPHTTPLQTRFGESIRIRFVNKSSSSHTMHVHGHDFMVIERDGFPQANWYDDTIDVPSGQRIDILLHANNYGVWPINGTKTFHQTNNGSAPGGMITRLKYE